MKRTELVRCNLLETTLPSLAVASEDALTALDGAVDARGAGIACPHDLNRVRWFAHLDGSPDSPGWDR